MGFVDADAGVGHLEAQPAGAGRCQAHIHPALGGELDRVAQQVQQDLLQAHAVAQHLPGRGGVHVDGQLQALAAGPIGHHVRHTLQALRGQELDGIELHLAGFDLGEVQDVVDQLQQLAAGIKDAPQVVLLARRQRVSAHQVRKTQHRVHRRADLVAHVGQEGALGLVGRVSRLLGLLQRDLGSAALHDTPQVGAGQLQLAHVGIVVGRGLVGRAQHQHDALLVEHRDAQGTVHRPGWAGSARLRGRRPFKLHHLAAGQHRFPYARGRGLVWRSAQRFGRAGSKALQVQVQFVLGHAVQAPCGAAGQRHRHIDAALEQLRLAQAAGLLAERQHLAQPPVFPSQAKVQRFQLGRAQRHQLFQVLAVADQFALGAHTVTDVDAGTHHAGAAVEFNPACQHQVGHPLPVARVHRRFDHVFTQAQHTVEVLDHKRLGAGVEIVLGMEAPDLVVPIARHFLQAPVPHHQAALCVQHEEHAGHRLHHLLAQAQFLATRLLGIDRFERVRQVLHQPAVQRHLLGVEVACGTGIQRQHAARPPSSQDGKRGRRQVTSLRSGLAPRLHRGVLGDVVHHRRLAGAQGPHGGPVVQLHVHLQLLDIAVGVARLLVRHHLAGGLVHVADPGHDEAAHFHGDAADLGLQLPHIRQAHDGLVDVAQHRVGPIEPAEAVLALPALGDVAPDH